jgi:hypothetical protein
MPLQFNKFIEPLRVFALVISIGSSFAQISASPIDKTLIESAILINHDELTDPGPLFVTSRFRRATISTALIEGNLTVTDVGGEAVFILNEVLPDGLASTMRGLFEGAGQNTNKEIKAGVQVALNYIFKQKNSLGLDAEQIGKATQAIVKAALEASGARDDSLTGLLKPNPNGLAQDLPIVVIGTFIPEDSGKRKALGLNIPELTKNLAEGMAKGVMTSILEPPSVGSSYVVPERETLLASISENTIKAILQQMNVADDDPINDLGFYPGIEPVDKLRKIPDANMTFGGPHEGHLRFHPDKTRILEYASNGLAYGALSIAKNPPPNINNIGSPDSLAKNIGSGAAKGAVNFLADLDEREGKDYSLFTYEVIKSIASGVSMGSVMVASSKQQWKNDKIPELVAEGASYGVASAAIEAHLVNKVSNNDIARIGESAAFGSSMGAQFATVFDPSADNYSAWDYEFYGKKASYDRIALAEATSRGSAQGAIGEAANENHLSELEEVASDRNTTGRQEVLNLARGTAMGAVLSNIAMAIYYETDLQSVIIASSKGSAYGSLAHNSAYGDLEHNTLGNVFPKPKGKTEEFEVEVARATAYGATTGTLFEVVSLLDAKPDVRRADLDSITSAKSASYGSTIGAILGGDVAGEDGIASIVLKQAAEQGATEGSMDGIALAKGTEIVDEEIASGNIKSELSIKKAVGIGNAQAATKAAGEMAVKSIKASSSDMLLLMRKYNISPGTTNPGFVFPNPKKRGEEDFLFDEKFPAASPI